jgi:rhodanese-related sulfurtransferase
MRQILLFLCITFSSLGLSQDNLSKLLKKYNQESIPYISVQELAISKTSAVLLDAREPEEFAVSHLKNAICVGYEDFNLNTVTNSIKNKDQDIVVYCSLGIRSEDIAIKLKKEGYKNVKNLFGGIFEWKNNNLKIYNQKNQTTDSIHAFSKKWSKWLKKGIKVYQKNLENND